MVVYSLVCGKEHVTWKQTNKMNNIPVLTVSVVLFLSCAGAPIEGEKPYSCFKELGLEIDKVLSSSCQNDSQSQPQAVTTMCSQLKSWKVCSVFKDTKIDLFAYEEEAVEQDILDNDRLEHFKKSKLWHLIGASFDEVCTDKYRDLCDLFERYDSMLRKAYTGK